MRRVTGWLILIVLAAATVGCGPELKREDLGEIQENAAQLPGAGEPYPLPKPQYEVDEGENEAASDKEAAASPQASEAAPPAEAATPPSESKSQVP